MFKEIRALLSFTYLVLRFSFTRNGKFVVASVMSFFYFAFISPANAQQSLYFTTYEIPLGESDEDLINVDFQFSDGFEAMSSDAAPADYWNDGAYFEGDPTVNYAQAGLYRTWFYMNTESFSEGLILRTTGAAGDGDGDIIMRHQLDLSNDSWIFDRNNYTQGHQGKTLKIQFQAYGANLLSFNFAMESFGCVNDGRVVCNPDNPYDLSGPEDGILILDFQSQNNNDRGSSSDYFSGKADWEDGYTSISSAQIGPGVIIQNQGHLQLGDVDYLMEKSTDALTSGSMWTTRGANNNGGGYAVFEQKAGTIDITNNFKMAGFFIKENGDLTAGSMLNEEGIFIQQDGYTTIVGEFKNQYDRDEEWTHRWIGNEYNYHGDQDYWELQYGRRTSFVTGNGSVYNNAFEGNFVVNGGVFNAGSFDNTGIAVINDGALFVDGDFLLGANREDILRVNGGQLHLNSFSYHSFQADYGFASGPSTINGGLFEQNGGVVNVYSDVTVKGHFDVTGGTFNATGLTNIANPFPGSEGSFAYFNDTGDGVDISGGTVAISGDADNSGLFRLSGGRLEAVNFSNSGYLETHVDYPQYQRLGGLKISGGDMALSGAMINSGEVVQTAGNVSMNGALTVESGGSYQLSDGNFRAAGLNLVDGVSALTWTGGGLDLFDTTMRVDGSGILGSDFILNGAQSLSAKALFVGAVSPAPGVTHSLEAQAGSSVSVTENFTVEADASFQIDGALSATDLVVAGSTTQGATGSTSISNDITLINGGSLTQQGGDVRVGDYGGVDTVSGPPWAVSPLVSGGTLSIDAGSTYNFNAGSLAFGDISVDPTGSFSWVAGNLAITGAAVNVDAGGLLGDSLDLSGAKNLQVVGMTVGDSTAHSGSVTQSAGSSNRISNHLAIAAGGSYSLTNASLSAGSLDNAGSLTQAGAASQVAIGGTFNLADTATYMLTGGSLSAQDMTVNGQAAIDGNLAISQGITVGSTGSLTQNSGAVSATDTSVDGSLSIIGGSFSTGSLSASGTVTQSGGAINVADQFELAVGASFSQSAGAVLSADEIVVAGTFEQAGQVKGVSEITINNGGVYSALASGMQIGDCQYAELGCGTFGVDLTTLTVKNGGVFNNEVFIWSDGATVEQGGQINHSDGRLSLGQGANFIVDGEYNLSGDGYIRSYASAHQGASTVLEIGANGQFNMSGGIVSLADVTGFSGGAFNFSGGDLILTEHDLAVDASGLLGDTVTIEDANLTVGSMSLGDGTPSSGTVLLQSGGYNRVNGDITLNAGGDYQMTGGQLVAESIADNGGAFNYVDGGIVLSASDIDINSASIVGASLTVDTGEEFGAVNQVIGTAAADSGTISFMGGRNELSGSQTIAAGGRIIMNASLGDADNLGAPSSSSVNLIAIDQTIEAGGTLEINNGFNRVGANQIVNGTIETMGVSNTASNWVLGNQTLNSSAVIQMNRGENRVFGDMNILAGASVELDEFADNLVSGSLSLAAGALYSQDGGDTVVIGDLDITTGASFTMNGGNLSAGRILSVNDFYYNGGGIRLTQEDMQISANGRFGDAVQINAGDKFGALNMYVGENGGPAGSILQTGGSNIMVEDLYISSGSTYDMSGGSLDVRNIYGSLNFTGGHIELGSDVNVGAGRALGSNVVLSDGMLIKSHIAGVGYGDLVINNGGSFTLDGGYIRISDVVINGTGSFNFASGHMKIDDLTIGTEGVLGDELTFNAYHLDSLGRQISVERSLTINSSGTLTVGDGNNLYGPAGAADQFKMGHYTSFEGYHEQGYIINNGVINLNVGGRLSANSVGGHRGTFNFNGGSLDLNYLTLSDSSQLGKDLIIGVDKDLHVAQRLTIENDASFTLTSEGSAAAGRITNNGDLIVESGAALGGDTIYQTDSLSPNASMNIDGSAKADIYMNVGSLSGTGTIEGDLTVVGDAIVNPGNSPGTLFVDGDFVLDGGTLNFEIEEADGIFAFDQLFVEGEYDLRSGDVIFRLGGDIDSDMFFENFVFDDFFLVGVLSAGVGFFGSGEDSSALIGLDLSVWDSTVGEMTKLAVDSDGSLTASAVPVPAAAWLFCSALLGLAGIKRYKN